MPKWTKWTAVLVPVFAVTAGSVLFVSNHTHANALAIQANTMHNRELRELVRRIDDRFRGLVNKLDEGSRRADTGFRALVEKVDTQSRARDAELRVLSGGIRITLSRMAAVQAAQKEDIQEIKECVKRSERPR